MTLQPICPFIGLPGSLDLWNLFTSHWSEQSYLVTLKVTIVFSVTLIVRDDKSRWSSVRQILLNISMRWYVFTWVKRVKYQKLKQVCNKNKSIVTFSNLLRPPQIISNYLILHSAVSNECQGINFRQENRKYIASLFKSASKLKAIEE